MPKINRKNIGRKQLQKGDKAILQKVNMSPVANKAPIDNEGREGQLTVRLINGSVKLYVKFRGKWYGVLLS